MLLFSFAVEPKMHKFAYIKRDTMRKNLLVVLSLCFAVAAGAQDIDDRAAYYLNIDTDLWYGSANAAGLARSDMAVWRNGALGYDLATGKFTDSWGARSQSSLSLNGDMLMNIEGFKVAVALDLDRNRLSKSRYNTSVYDVRWDMPYFVAINSDESFVWKKSHAGVDVSAASPLFIDDMLSFGVNLKVDLKGASKSAVPKCRFSGLELEIMPSATVAIADEHIVGLSLGYKFQPSRSVLSSGATPVSAALLKGLGSYTPRWVGGNLGMAPINYNSGAFAIALDYNYLGESSDWLLEISFDKWNTNASEQDVTIGKIDKFVTGFSAKGLFGESRSRKLSLDIQHNLNYWLEGVNATPKGTNSQLDANLDYTVYTGTNGRGEAFDWMFGLGSDMHWLGYKRYFPEGKFSVVNLLPYASIGKNINFSKEQSLLARLNLGYNFSAGATYNYKGESVGNNIVNLMYDNEMDFLGSYYLRTALSADYTYRLNTILAPYAALDMGLLTPMGGSAGSRFLLSLKVGVLF